MASHGIPTLVSSDTSLSDPLRSFELPQHPPQLALSAEQMQHCYRALDFLKLKWESPHLIELEFESLEKRSKKESDIETSKEKDCTVAIHPINKCKNRYENVLPFDSNRVVLTDKDYINASFIKTNAERVPLFIATQGPKPNTCEDFWEMVLQFRCPMILMFTRLVENGKVKCHDYFQGNENGDSKFGNISIVTKWMEQIGSSVVFRLLEITKEESKESPLSLLHIHYLEWPDHGTPNGSLAIRNIFRRTYHLPPGVGPILVHCSAGIGRTGTYCTIHATIQRIIAGDSSALDFASTVEAFRSQRAGMTQSLGQYKYCYEAVIDELKDIIASYQG